MKFKFLILIPVILINTNFKIVNDNFENHAYEYLQNSVCLQFYNRLLVSNNIVSLSNKAIDQLASQRTNVPTNVWTTVKNNINYSSFITDMTDIICANYSQDYMITALEEYSDREYIDIASWKVKKEMYEVANNFKPVLEQQINTILSQNGY